MKRLIIVFLLISILVGGAFAQVSFSGEVHAGIQLERLYGSDETITADSREKNAPFFDFAVTVMREDYGARLDTTFQATDDPAGAGHFTLNGIFGWVNFWDNQIRLTMGRISDAAWVANIDADLRELQLDDITGFRVEYQTPLPGLSVGMAVPTDGHDFEGTMRRLIFGANYIHPMFSAVFAYDLSSNVSSILGFNFTGIPDLTAGFQLMATNLASWDSDFFPGAIETHQKVGYRIMRPLDVHLILGQAFTSLADTDPFLEFTPGVSYRFLPNLTGTLRMTLDSDDLFETTNLTFRSTIEYILRGPARFYVEYEMRLNNMERVDHRFGFGIEILAF